MVYSNVIVKALDGKLLNPDRVRRMLDAADIAGAVKVLYECGYDESPAAQTSGDIERLLNSELTKTVNFFKKMCADSNLLKAVLRRYDYHNLKALSKEKYCDAGADRTVYSFGAIHAERMRHTVKEETYNDFPPVMAEACRMLKKLFAAGEPSAKLIDMTFDMAMYNDTAVYIKKITNAYIRQYFTSEADLRNMCTAVRMKMQGFDKDALSAQLVKGGNLDNEKLYKLYSGDPDEMERAFLTTGYYELVKELEVIMAEDRPLSDFDRSADEFLFELSRADRDNFFDNSPLFC